MFLTRSRRCTGEEEILTGINVTGGFPRAHPTCHTILPIISEKTRLKEI